MITLAAGSLAAYGLWMAGVVVPCAQSLQKQVRDPVVTGICVVVAGLLPLVIGAHLLI